MGLRGTRWSLGGGGVTSHQWGPVCTTTWFQLEPSSCSKKPHLVHGAALLTDSWATKHVAEVNSFHWCLFICAFSALSLRARSPHGREEEERAALCSGKVTLTTTHQHCRPLFSTPSTKAKNEVSMKEGRRNLTQGNSMHQDSLNPLALSGSDPGLGPKPADGPNADEIVSLVS